MHTAGLHHPWHSAITWVHTHHHPAHRRRRHDYPSRCSYLEYAEMARAMDHL
ncbi:hypothetical protein [Mycolicibacterium sp. F2034L]|uniref:hypothetical protein n=1 Tax=Mycolicibacterium sp. F2034L TaxID=2926422 RepID=UPI001FF5DB18|nr:hypothetical protein [Mycolicibacterium sp. F2034L]MCK0177585.1 hypothetical protein [Mycolicibacterium sp. F2034L]